MGGNTYDVDPLEDDGALTEHIFENLPEGVYVPRGTIQVVLETLVRLDYGITEWIED